MRTIVVDPLFLPLSPVLPRLQDALNEDILPDLTAMTGHSFTQSATVPSNWEAQGNAVIFVLARKTAVGTTYPIPQAVISDLPLIIGKPQAFLIYAEGGVGTWIVAEEWRGAMHGLFEFLHRLGARYFLPGDLWKIIPQRLDIQLTVHEFREPCFDTLFWFPSSYAVSYVMDAPDLQREAWYQWFKQNLRPIGHGSYLFRNSQRVTNEAQPIPSQPDSAISALDDLYMTTDATHPIQDPFNFALLVDKSGVLRRATPDASDDLFVKKGYLNFTYHGCGSAASPHECLWSPAKLATPSTLAQPAIHIEPEDAENYVSYGGVIQQYGDWLDQQIILYNADVNALDPSVVPVFSVDPANDGENDSPSYFCQCQKCLDLLRNGPYHVDGVVSRSTLPNSSISDRVFHFAYQVAQHLVSTYPDYRFSVYAYDQTIAVPSISLHPNLLVIVDPYYLSGYLSEWLIGQWVAKSNTDGSQVAIYDHWAMPSWHQNRPVFTLRTALDHLRFWYSYAIRVFNGESTTSVGAVGLHWYLMQRLVWDPGADVDTLLDEFFTTAFGPAAEFIRPIFDRWSMWHTALTSGTAGYEPSAYEFGELFADLVEAYQKVVGNREISQRVEAIIAYAQYLRLYQAYQDLLLRFSPPSQVEIEALIDSLLRLIWRSYDTLFIQSQFMHDVLIGDSNLSHDFVSRWSLNNSTWRDDNKITSFTEVEWQTMLQQGKTDFPRLELSTIQSLSDQLVPIDPSISNPIGGTAENEDHWLRGDEGPNEAWFAFYVKENQSGFLTFQADAADCSIGQVRFVTTGPDTRLVVDETISINGKCETDLRSQVNHSFPLSTLAAWHPGLYQVHVFMSASGTYTFAYPDNLPFVRIGPQNHCMTSPDAQLYFFVPQDVTRFAFYTANWPKGSNTTPVFSWYLDVGSGKSVDPMNVKQAKNSTNTWIVDVPSDAQMINQGNGKVWSLSNYNYTYRLLNLPNIFARSYTQLLVPTEFAL